MSTEVAGIGVLPSTSSCDRSVGGAWAGAEAGSEGRGGGWCFGVVSWAGLDLSRAGDELTCRRGNDKENEEERKEKEESGGRGREVMRRREAAMRSE